MTEALINSSDSSGCLVSMPSQALRRVTTQAAAWSKQNISTSLFSLKLTLIPCFPGPWPHRWVLWSHIYHYSALHCSQAYDNISQAFRPFCRQPQVLQPRFTGLQLPSIFHTRNLSSETRTAIDKAIASAPVVLFMKGTPETPQCGFSRASIQILGLQGVDPKKFVAFNVLEDSELRQGMSKVDWRELSHAPIYKSANTRFSRHQRVFRLAYNPAIIFG